MQSINRNYICAAQVAMVLFASGPTYGQTSVEVRTNSQFKFSTRMAPGVAVPDKIESSIGTLNLSYGYPDADTVEKIYDNIDRSCALQAYLMAIPIVNQAGMRDSLRKFGPDNQTDVIWSVLSQIGLHYPRPNPSFYLAFQLKYRYLDTPLFSGIDVHTTINS